jgi:hypothetical protein
LRSPQECETDASRPPPIRNTLSGVTVTAVAEVGVADKVLRATVLPTAAQKSTNLPDPFPNGQVAVPSPD